MLLLVSAPPALHDPTTTTANAPSASAELPPPCQPLQLPPEPKPAPATSAPGHVASPSVQLPSHGAANSQPRSPRQPAKQYEHPAARHDGPVPFNTVLSASATAVIPAAGVGPVPAGTGGCASGRGAAVLQPAPPKSARHHEFDGEFSARTGDGAAVFPPKLVPLCVPASPGTAVHRSVTPSARELHGDAANDIAFHLSAAAGAVSVSQKTKRSSSQA